MRKTNRRYQKNMNIIMSYFFIFVMMFSIVFSKPVFAIEAKENIAVATQESSFKFSNGKITEYTGTVTDVVIPEQINGETVTSIGDKAFYNKKLTSVKIPSTVDSIGKQAFATNNLTTIDLPEKLANMGDGAFSGNKLTSVKIPDSLEEIPNVAFSKNKLTSVVIPEGVKTIGMGAFTINQLESLVIPDSVTFIDKTAFKQNSLKSVKISENIENIGISVFDTNQLQSVTIPEGVTKIEDAAFRNNQLQSVTIPINVSTIGINVFDGNLNISLTYAKLVKAIKNAESINTSGKSEKNVQVLKEALEAAKELNNNPKATLTQVNTAVENINTAVEGLDFTITNGEITAYTGNSVDVVISEKINGEIVTAIGASAFRNKSLNSVKIPNTVETIKLQAFSTNKLTSVELPSNLRVMEGLAFAQNKLTSIIIPEGLTSIPSGAFSMNELSSVLIPEGVTNISSGAFKTNKLGAVTIPRSITAISSNAFDGNTNIKLNYSKLSESIKNAENIDKSGKSEVNVQALKEALEAAKELNNKPKATLTEINVVVDKIDKAIKALSEEVSIKTSIKEIKALQNIEVGFGTSEADAKTKLPRKITIVDSQNVEHNIDITWSISGYNGSNVGEYNAVGIFELPEGVVQSNPPMELKATIKIIVKVEEVENKGWNTKDFTYIGTAITGFSESGKEKFKTNKNLVLPAFNESGQAITEIGDKAFVGDYTTKQNPNIGINSVNIPITVTTIGAEAFRYNCLTSIDIPSSVTTIKMSAFNGNKIKALVIPDSVTKLEGGSFTLNEIESLKLPNGLTTIPPAFAFNNLTSVTIPEGVTRIDDLAFSDNRLSEVKLPSTLKYLSGLNNNEFRSITIPKTVTELGQKAFASNWMKSVTIPGNVKIIGERAFWNTWHDQFLSSVVIEKGVERIDAFAFCNNHLKDIQLPSTLKQLHKDTFSTNLGYDGAVHVYTHNYENPNNFQESKYHIINPAKIIIKYVFGDKVLKEKEIWKNPKTGEFLHVGDKDVELALEYSDNEYELKYTNAIKLNLNNKDNIVSIQCKKKEVSEKIRIKSIGKVAPVTVNFGIGKETVMDKLARKTFIIDSNNQEHQVELNWTLGVYNGDKSGEYTAVGTFKLPEGVVQSEPEMKLEVISQVTVKEKVGNPENRQWEVEDFIYAGTIITGFSSVGKEKLKVNKDLVLPKVNGKGEAITAIGEGAFANMSLISLIIPEGVHGLVVNAGAFKENQLKRVYIPEGVKEILTLAFYKNDLSYVDFPGTLEKIGNQAFANNKLVYVNIAKGTGKICLDRFSFYGNQLTSITILKKVNKVHEEAFKDNKGYENDNNKVHIFMSEVDEENNGLFEYSNYHKIILLEAESVENLKPIELFAGAEKNSIFLPQKIKIKLNNEDVIEVNVTWSSSNKEVATVDASGKVTGIKEGTAIITATTEDGSKVATCEVVVKLSKIVSSTSGSSSKSENSPKFEKSSKSQEIAVMIKNIREDYLVNNKFRENNNFRQSFTEFSYRYSSAIAKLIVNNAKLNTLKKYY